MRFIETNGVTLAATDEGSGEAVVFLHGFPELAYSWRYQIPALARAGYRAIAPDQRGYGASSKPTETAQYSLPHLVDDVIGVLDSLDIESATIVGHDWGSIIAWTAAITFPERVSRVASLNVPYRGACVGFPTTDVIREHLSDRFGYVLMFQDEGVVETMFEADPEAWLSGVYPPIAATKDFLSIEDFAVFAKAFSSGGIAGPVNWYRNIDANAEHYSQYLNAPITQPTLMIVADRDPVLPMSLSSGVDRWVANLTTVTIENSGHWTQQEQPEAVTAALLAWLDET